MNYKGVEIDSEMHGLIRYMHTAEEYRNDLQSLQATWDNLALLGHLSGTGADMSDTRSAFNQLTSALLNQLSRETLKKTLLGMHSKAQVAIDILIRNLFERTADIGFLAMDQEIRNFLKRSHASGGEVLESWVSEMNQRFHEYAQKYSVYKDIVLMDPAGKVLARMTASGAARSEDPLIRETLESKGGYVETFRWCDLQPEDVQSLIYSWRVVDEDGGSPLGVLCLCFRFEDEADQIFANLVDSQDWSVVTLLDGQGRVIASSDGHHIPVGAVLEPAVDVPWRITRFAGREYLTATRSSHGYQGYMGPGWFGHVMIPIEHAFDDDQVDEAVAISGQVLESVTRNSHLFSERLRSIPLQAAAIQRNLNRSVWNGNVRQRSDQAAMNPAFSKVLLWEISNTGLKTQDVFERSIANLNQTVVSSILQDSAFQASLAIDIMDRNLYERANDCRWWALAPIFREALANPVEAQVEQAHRTLASINALYTVYLNLVLFDRDGMVVAVSNPEFQRMVGQAIGEEWVRQTLSLKDGQGYVVSPFAATPLYNDRPTYVYAAAVMPPGKAEPIGGIGIVFDAAPQFEAMLSDSLPRNEHGDISAGCFGLFLDRHRRVVASTNPSILPGAQIDLDERFFQLDNRASRSSIEAFQGVYYAVGARMSGGYREYKGPGDRYRNDIVALVFVPLGEEVVDRRQATPAARRKQLVRSALAGEQTVEIATFYIDSHWLGVTTEHVVEAIQADRLTAVPGSQEEGHHYLMFRDRVIPVVGLWGAIGKSDRRHTGDEPQVIILSSGRPGDDESLIGIFVDELGEIPEVPVERVERISQMVAGENLLADRIVKPEQGDSRGGMIVLLSIDRLLARFLQSAPIRVSGG